MSVAFLIARLLAGGFFVWSGSTKLGHSRTFWAQIMGYELVGARAARAFAAFLPIIELIAGLFFAAGIYSAASGSVVLTLLVGFSVAITSSLARKLGNDCGCAGTGGRVSPRLLLRNGVLAALAVAGIFSNPPPTPGAAIAATLGGALVILIGIGSYQSMTK